MDTLPTELKLHLFETVASQNVFSVLALSSVNRAFRVLYKSASTEHHLLATFANAFIFPKNRLACRVLSALPKENWYSTHPEPQNERDAEAFLESTKGWLKTSDDLRKLETQELKDMIRTHAMVRHIENHHSQRTKPKDEYRGTFTLYELYADTEKDPSTGMLVIRGFKPKTIGDLNCIYGVLIIGHRQMLYPFNDKNMYRSRFSDVIGAPEWMRITVQRSYTLSLLALLRDFLDLLPLEEVRDKCEVEIEMHWADTWIHGLAERFASALDVRTLFRLCITPWRQRGDVVCESMKRVAEIRWPQTIIARDQNLQPNNVGLPVW